MSILQNKKYPFRIMKPSVQLQNMRMPKAHLNRQISLQLMLQPILFNLLFKHYKNANKPFMR
ncbi:hypothetical protein HanPSC8_Chr05g0186731 [Helianthus annuus]|nr:hypothetical protein HanPSC8_Chr05g0186731 [Helianthus annuus]